jgi:polyhydroxyalkanoate synthesis regulator phasin
MSKYDDIVNMYHKIFGGEIEEIRQQVIRNATIGTNSMSNAVLDMAKPRETVMSSLDNLEASYRKALLAELEMSISTKEKKLTIETAMSAPTMNLNLISDRAKREELNTLWQDITLTGVRENLGLPSTVVPSGNIRTETAYLNVPQPLPGDPVHPYSTLMSGRAVSVSRVKSGERAMTVSGSSIPTRKYLETMMERQDPAQFIQNAIDQGRKLTFMTSDIETGGVGPYDLARSVFGQVYEMPTEVAGTDVSTAIKGLTPTGDTFDFHMLLPEMQTLTRGQRGGLPSVQLGGRLADIETGRFLGGGRTAAGTGRIFDLATQQGRTQSAAELMGYFEKLVHPDTVLVGNNFVNFDIPKLVATASTLEEFMKNPEAKTILEAVQEKAGSGNVIDVTDLARKHLSGKVQERMAAAARSGLPGADILNEGLTSLLSPESLAKAGIEAQGVKPFGIENIVTSTNVLELMYQSKDPRMRAAVEELSKGSHVSSLDAALSMGIYQNIVSGELDIVDQANRSTVPEVVRALNAVSRASATVPTSNIASVGEISDQVFDFLTDTSGASDRTLLGARVQTIGMTGEVDGFVHYNPQIGRYEKVSMDGTTRTLGGSAGAADTTLSRKINRNAGLFEIRKAMQEDSDKLGDAGYTQQVISTGINVAEASQMNSTLAAVSRFSGLPTVARGPMGFLATEADEDAFAASMIATRKHIGFPHLRDTPDSVTSGPGRLDNNMLERFDVPSATAMAAAQDAVYQGGAGLAVLDPVMRSNFVALSAQTAHIPYEGKKVEMAKEIAKKAEAQRALAEGRIVTDAELDAFVSSLNEDQIQNINLRATESSRYLSEQTMIHVPTMKTTRVIDSAGQATKPLISRSLLAEMVTEDSSGATIPIVDSALWKQAGLDTATFSIVKSQDKDIVNLVLGKGRMSSESATKFANSLITVLKDKEKNRTAEQLVSDGYASTIQEAQVLKSLLSGSGSSEEQQRAFTQQLVDRLMESGPVVGALEGKDAAGPKVILEALGSEINNDQPAIARGAVFQMQNLGQETISISGALPQAAQDQLNYVGGAVSAQTNAELAGGLMDTHLQALAKAETSSTFRKKLQTTFSRAGVDNGILGTSIGRNRVARDGAILETLAKVKPKLAMGAIAVGAASAGYYLAKRNRTSRMYDEVMDQQPYEDPGLVQDANSGIQQDNQQTSARRDPLVTAGVVGNLDRNKIGHTAMGPNKYNHLYGG